MGKTELNDNIRRCLKNVVSLDGWIGEFAEGSKANVHVDVVFREAIFGDKPDNTVTFKLTLQRAEVFLVVGNEDPIKVIRSTISRTVTDNIIAQKQESVFEQSAEASAALAAVLAIRTKEQRPLNWAIANFNLAITQQSYASSFYTQDADPVLNDALDNVEDALTVFTSFNENDYFVKAHRLRTQLLRSLGIND